MHERIRHSLLNIDNIFEVHHQHLWSLDGEHHVLTAHIIINQNKDFNLKEYSAMKQSIANALEQYQLAHTTIEIELNQEFCRDQSKLPF